MSTMPQISGIADFADDYLGAAEGADLGNAGAAARAIAERVGAEAAVPLIATTLWQTLIRSPAFARVLSEADLRVEETEGREIMIVGHPIAEGVRPRYDLVILDAALRDERPVTVDPDPSAHELAAGWEVLEEDQRAYRELHPEADLVDDFNVVQEALAADEFRVLIAGLPRQIATASAEMLSVAAFPAPAWTVRRHDASQTAADVASAEYATAGLIEANADGVLGVTVPHHLLAGTGATAPVPAKTSVWVTNMLGEVVSSDIPSDSCFVRLPRTSRSEGIINAAPSYGGRGTIEVQEVRKVNVEGPTGLLSGIFPRQGEPTVFEGALSGRQIVRITAWSPDLLLAPPWSQCKVFTEARTGGGDSGAALRDFEGQLVGFAFGRTEYDEIPEYSSWIWAESVVRAHRLVALLAKATRRRDSPELTPQQP
jgi:hypothetical protein